jgi:hypothetical protein
MAVAGVSEFLISFPASRSVFSLPAIRFFPASSRSFFPCQPIYQQPFVFLHFTGARRGRSGACRGRLRGAERSREETENAIARERARETARDREELF